MELISIFFIQQYFQLNVLKDNWLLEYVQFSAQYISQKIFSVRELKHTKWNYSFYSFFLSLNITLYKFTFDKSI